MHLERYIDDKDQQQIVSSCGKNCHGFLLLLFFQEFTCGNVKARRWYKRAE